MTNEITTHIYYGIYDITFDQFYIRNAHPLIIPNQFKEYIKRMTQNKWQWKYRKAPFIFFTIGVDGDIQALSIVHPKDTFDAEMGKCIVEGRLNRQLGLLNRPTYDQSPETSIVNTDLYDAEGNIVYKEVPPYIITGD